MHMGKEADKDREKMNFRMIPYLSYLPKSGATEKDLEKRIKAFESSRTCSHWAYPIKMFPKSPRTWGKPLPAVRQLDAPVLSDVGRSLVGYD